MYETVELADLIQTSMTNRKDSKIHRISEQNRKIKNFVPRMGGTIYGKGAKSATSYIEFYFMDVGDYAKMKERGVKVIHADDVVRFINEHQNKTENFIAKEKNGEAERLALEKAEIARQKEWRKQMKKQQEEEKVKKATTPHPKLLLLDDNGENIESYDNISDACKQTNANDKSEGRSFRVVKCS